MSKQPAPRVALIWAMSRNRVIGRNNSLPWHLPADMVHFKTLTMDHPVIMGRKTYESLGRPLPGRTNIVISRDPAFRCVGCLTVGTLEDSLRVARQHMPAGKSQIFVIGGQNIYTQMLPRADRLYITLIDAEIDGDAMFPELDLSDWSEISREEHPADGRNSYPFTFLTLERKTPRSERAGC